MGVCLFGKIKKKKGELVTLHSSLLLSFSLLSSLLFPLPEGLHGDTVALFVEEMVYVRGERGGGEARVRGAGQELGVEREAGEVGRRLGGDLRWEEGEFERGERGGGGEEGRKDVGEGDRGGAERGEVRGEEGERGEVRGEEGRGELELGDKNSSPSSLSFREENEERNPRAELDYGKEG